MVPPGRTDAQGVLERLLPSQRFDRHVHAAAVGEAADDGDGVLLRMIDEDVGAETPGHLETLRHVIHRDDEGSAAKFRSERRAQSGRSLREHRDAVADAHVAALSPRDPRRQDVGHEDDVFVGELFGNRREIRPRVGHEQILGPGAVDRVAEPPAARRPVALRIRTVEARVALPARRDGADDHALADVVLGLETLAEGVNHPDGLVAEHQSRLHGVFTAHDIDVGAADRRHRDLDHRLPGAGHRLGPLFNRQPIRAAKHHRLHDIHLGPPPIGSFWSHLLPAEAGSHGSLIAHEGDTRSGVDPRE